MAEHAELVQEMNLLEKMTTQDRLKLARKRRMQQLKKWTQREKEFANKRKKGDSLNLNLLNRKDRDKNGPDKDQGDRIRSQADYKVHFVPSVMLLEAAARNDVQEVRRLLMLGVSPDSTNEDGLTALHQCCIDDSEDMMKLLIEFKANVNARDTEQWTPLHAAATCGHLHLVKHLIARGANLLSVNADGNMPYDICEDETTLDYIENEMAKKQITQDMIDQTRVVTENRMLNDLKLMAQKGDDLEYRDAAGATPLHIGSANGYLSVVEFLLDNHVSTDVFDNDQWQPVHAAACWGHPDVLEMLVQAGADLHAKTKNQETPFDICEDPELKERIVTLQSEMETKRASTTHRLKRSHSSNTRSQSVRRTSIREKSQISRREAREELRIRQEIQHESSSQSGNKEDEEESTVQDKENRQVNHSNHLLDPNSASISSPLDETEPSITKLYISDQRDSGRPHMSNGLVQPVPSTSPSINLSPVHNDLKTPHCPPASNGTRSSSSPQHHPSLPEVYSTSHSVRNGTPSVANPLHSGPRDSSSRDSVKVEIHVTVNTSPTSSNSFPVPSGQMPSSSAHSSTSSTSGTTLSNLKKLRSEQRIKGHDVEDSGSDSGPSPQPNGSNGQVAEVNGSKGHMNNNNFTSSNNHFVPNSGSSPSGSTLTHRSIRGSAFIMESTTTSSGVTPGILMPHPSSPSNTLKKFRGDPSEVVGGDFSKQGCCVIS